MDKKTKIFFLVFFLALALSVLATYYRIVIARDYMIAGQADCDPAVENCFIYECDPEVEECTGDPEEDVWYYKKVNRKAANIPLCDPSDESCEALVCSEDEEECEEILCSEETVEEGDVCSDPETYISEHPEALEGDEDVVECEEGNEECIEMESENAICEEDAENCAVDENNSIEEGENNVELEEGRENDTVGSGNVERVQSSDLLVE